MDDLLSEKEQIDQIRSWWSTYGGYVIGGIAIGAAFMIGLSHIKSTELQAQLDASMAYETLVGHVSDGKLEEAEAVADEIAASYSDTTYAGQSGLAMARLYMDKNRDQDAADVLLAVVEGAGDERIKHVARLRLARIYLYQEKAQEVVDLLESQDSSAFAPSYGEVLGDAYTALGQIAAAQDAYQQVLTNPLSQGTVDQQLVQWKALDLPEVTAEPAVDSTEPAAAPAVESDDTSSDDAEDSE